MLNDSKHIYNYFVLNKKISKAKKNRTLSKIYSWVIMVWSDYSLLKRTEYIYSKYSSMKIR